MRSLLKFRLCLLCLISLQGPVLAQQSARIAFYNVENFFDYFDDTLKNDDTFTPRGSHGWNKVRYERKCKQLYKAISALGGEEPPAVLGLCEVENKKVLTDLIYGTPLRKYNCRYVHYESGDSRGIDVALIYRPDVFRLLDSYPIPVIFPPDTISRTRDMLYVKGLLFHTDTLHIFVCHFPSKYGGLMATKSRRSFVGHLLRTKMYEITNENVNAYIITMGDFNDEPSDESIAVALGARCDTANLQKTDYINLMCRFEGRKGSHKYRETWSIIDQMIVSGALMKGESGLQVKNKKAYIFDADFLLMPDDVHLGHKPFRTYLGMRYLGGFSDHLPVYLDIERDKDSNIQ